MNVECAPRKLALNLYCDTCSQQYPIDQLSNYAQCCNQPLLVSYALSRSKDRSVLLSKREHTMWRYSEWLPLNDNKNRVSLGEGMTPISSLKRLGPKYGFDHLFVKDESLNPTGSFKSRGLSMAISMAKEHGIEKIVMPTAGNAGGALSAYSAAAGISSTIVMPRHTPKIFQKECDFYGSKVELIDGLIDKCGQRAAEIGNETGAFNFSTLKEPYRLEGKKTMGYEIAEQFDWMLPDVILYPTGGGTGLIGIWKAFQEMVEMGWLDSERLPRMIAVQSENCCPVIDYLSGKPNIKEYQETIAEGLGVPKAFGMDLIAKVIEESKGSWIAVEEGKILEATAEFVKLEGIALSPESGATWLALKKLSDLGVVKKDEKVLLLNTGNALKYLDSFKNYF